MKTGNMFAGRRLAVKTGDALGSLLDLSTRRVAVKRKSVGATFHGDWERIGRDMGRAMKSVRDQVVAKKG